MPIMYFGSKISENMVKTPEGYLICKNVPIGRTGWMKYLGEELGIEDMRGKTIQVYRSPEELFSKATIASFEGKSVTNNHPAQNLTLDTVSMLERGHVENVRQDGDYLVADLYIKDAGLIAEIDNGKREVSCGYDCLWVPMEDGKRYEQKEIIGNHVAIVHNGRAGSRVAIKDAQPEIIESNTGGNKMKTKKGIIAKMFKAFAADATPEEVADAMDALNEGEPSNQPPEKPVEQTPASQEEDATKQIMTALTQIGESIKDLATRVSALEESDKAVHEEIGADAELDNLEQEVKGADESPEEEKEEAADAESEEAETVEEEAKDEEKEEVADANPMVKFIQDMKPIIMAIPDESTRNATAKKFAQSVRDALPTFNQVNSQKQQTNGYGMILNTVAINKKQAMDSNNKPMSQEEAAQVSVNAWNKNNAHYKEGK